MNNYKDISYKFDNDDIFGASIVEKQEAIRQALLTIIMTKKGAKTIYGLPEFGSNIYKFLFMKMNVFTEVAIRDEIMDSIENWEPRVDIIDIDIEPDYDNYAYIVNVYYKINSLQITDTLTIKLDVVQ